MGGFEEVFLNCKSTKTSQLCGVNGFFRYQCQLLEGGSEEGRFLPLFTAVSAVTQILRQEIGRKKTLLSQGYRKL